MPTIKFLFRAVLQFQHVLHLYFPLRRVSVLRSTIYSWQNISYGHQSTNVRYYSCVFADIQGVYFIVTPSTEAYRMTSLHPLARPVAALRDDASVRLSVTRIGNWTLCGSVSTQLCAKFIGSVTAILSGTALALNRTLDIAVSVWVEFGKGAVRVVLLCSFNFVKSDAVKTFICVPWNGVTLWQ